jgi:hypothetical protein
MRTPFEGQPDNLPARVQPLVRELLDETISKEWNFVLNEMRRRYDAVQVKI